MNWVLTHWPSIALAILPLLAVRFCWDFRENMNIWAWGLYAVFIASFFSSNAAAFVPIPDEKTLEAARIWVANVQLYQEISYKACVVTALGIAFLAGFRAQIRGATALLMATVLAALGGEFLESTYCRLNDPVRHVSHIYLFEGGRNPTCVRMVEFGIAPWMSWLGWMFMPALTVIPSVIAMGWTARKKRLST